MVYLDNNATTRPSPAVVEAVNRGLTELWHNPSSVHRPGQAARQAVELARRSVAELIGAKPREITFTGSGTESIDLAIRGVLAAAPAERQALVTDAIEHSAVRDLAEQLAREGRELRQIPILPGGIVDTDALPRLLEDGRVGVVSVQWANNETGAVQPIERIARICREHGVPFHCDGTQWVGKMPVGEGSQGGAFPGPAASPGPSAPPSLPFDLLSFSPHKFHGPKGIGVLWARRGVRMRPTLHGTQELGRRGGTENVPGILGAGVAAAEARAWLADASARERLAGLRDRLERGVLERVPGAVVNAPGRRSSHGPETGAARLWNTTNIGFPRLEAEALLLLLSERGICASAGAACSSGSLDPSPVLLAMGVPPEVAHGSVRFSLSRETTGEEIERAIEGIAACALRLAGTMPGPKERAAEGQR